MGNPTTARQLDKLFDSARPLFDNSEAMQKFLGSGLFSDLVKSFENGNGENISRNEFRKVSKLPFYQTVEVAKEILGERRVLYKRPFSPENPKGFNFDLIPYFKETLLWAKDQNEKEDRNICLVEIPGSTGSTFSEIQADLIRDNKDFDFLNNDKTKKECSNPELFSIFREAHRVWEGYYLVDFGEKKLVLFSEERKRRDYLSVPSACLFLYFLGKFFKITGRYWMSRSGDSLSKRSLICIRMVDSTLKLEISVEENHSNAVFIGDSIDGEDIHLIKRDEY